jgi:anion-transporting  ArsA/GET3 family ATPase
VSAAADTPVLDVLGAALRSRIVLCCGSGGVGKTTTSAAIGYLAAAHGRRALVMTIDPARRLAQALGLESLADAPGRVAHFAAAGGGELHAMVLDSKRTFDTLIEKYASNETVRATILDNAYYQHLSNSLAGSREFMALEKVYEVVADGAFDVVIVDTPPSQHALEFLDAPRRLFDLFEGSFVKLLLQPYRLAGRISFQLFRRSSEAFLGVLEKLTGYQVLADLSDFFLAFSDMFDGFKERSRVVMKMLAEPSTCFVLVAAPDPASLRAADRFFARLAQEGLPVGGLIVNRVHRSEQLLDASSYQLSPGDVDALTGVARAAAVDATRDATLESRLLAAYRDHVSLAALDASAIETTALARAAVPMRRVPHFNRDLHSLDDVADFAAALSAPN